jgi:hypothetical protein
MKTRLAAALVSVVLLMIIASSAKAEEKRWSWFVASSVMDDWILEKGTAKVTLTQTTFSAELYVGDDLRHRITGSRKGNNLKVKLSTEETEQVDYPLSGTYERRDWKNFSSKGAETITLYWGGIVVGFTREITK